MIFKDAERKERRNQACARYRKAHPDRVRKFRQNWRTKNRDRFNQISARYYQNNKEAVKARNQKYHDLNKDKIAAQQKIYRSTRKELKAAQNKRWRDVNAVSPSYKQKRNEAHRKRYRQNKVKILQQHKQWRKKNPHRWKALISKRRALQRKVAVNLKGIADWMKSVKSKPVVTCYYCSKRVPSCDIHFDHIIPISKGGPHCLENLCVSCEPCNLSKSYKFLKDWNKDGQLMFAI